MAEPRAHEVIPQAIVKEVPIEGLPTIQAANLAKEVRKGIDKGNFREGLQRITEVQEVRYEEFAKKTTTFGTEINDNPQSLDYGKVRRTQEEEGLLLRIKNFEGLSKKFFEKGYDSLDNGEKAMIRAKILEQARRLPQLAPQIARLEAAGQGDVFAERYIKDPAFSAELKNKVNELLEQPFDNDVLVKFEEFMEAKNAADIARAEMEELQTKLDLAQSKVNSFKRNQMGSPETGASNAQRIDELKSGNEERRQQILDLEQQLIAAESDVQAYQTRQQAAFNMFPGTMNAQQKTGLENSFAQADRERAALQQRVSNLTQQLGDLKPQYPEATDEEPDPEPLPFNKQPADYQDAHRDLSRKLRAANEALSLAEEKYNGLQLQRQEAAETMGTIQGAEGAFGNVNGITEQLSEARARAVEIRQNLARFKGEEQELRTLEAEETQAQEAVSSLERQKREILERQQKTDMQLQRNQREYLAAKEARLMDEKTFTERLDSSWGRASNEIIAQQMEQANRIFGEELEAAREVSKSEHERVFLTTLQSTYLGPERTRTKGFGPFKRSESYRPLDKVSVLRDYSLLLRQGDVPLVRSIFERTINPDTGENFNNDEIDDIFEKNPDLIKKARPEAVKQLLARKALLGGMTHEDIYIISTSEWGKDMIQRGLDQNVEFRRTVEQVMGADALSRHGFADRFKQEMAKHPFWWSILLGIPAAIRARDMMPGDEELTRQG